jgi:hypothetical protein
MRPGCGVAHSSGEFEVASLCLLGRGWRQVVFVGTERKQIVADLVKTFESVADAPKSDGGGSKFVCLASLPGTGKTRIIQEFFATLSATHDESGYWPASLIPEDTGDVSSLIEGRKRVYPLNVDVPENADMPWMWWGLSCARRADGSYAQVMFDDATQINAHGSGIVGRRALLGAAPGLGVDLTATVVGLLGLLGMTMLPGLPAAIALTGFLRVIWEGKRFFNGITIGNPQGEVDVQDHGRESELTQLVENLSRISRKVPIVIVVDDAHWADQGLINVIDGLLQDKSSRVLILATTWPHALDQADHPGESAISGPFTKWWAGQLESPQASIINVEALSQRDLKELLRSDAAWLTEDQTAALMEHVRENPLTARVLLRTDRTQGILKSDSFSATDLQGIPHDLKDAFRLYWRELPKEVRAMLARAAQLGTTYVSPPVIKVATDEGLRDPEVVLTLGANPYSWATEIEEQMLYSFTEPPMYEIALDDGRNELLAPSTIFALWDALVDHVNEVNNDDLDLVSSDVQECLWPQHVELAKRGFADTLHASVSAFNLAKMSAARYDYKSAIDLQQLAIGWDKADPSDRTTLSNRGNLALWYGESGRFDDAIAEYDRLVQDMQEHLGRDDRETLSTRNNRALFFGKSGRVTEAIAQLEALSFAQTRSLELGSRDPDTLLTLSNLAHWYGESAQFKQATDLLERISNTKERFFGPQDPRTFATNTALAYWIGKGGRAGEAKNLLEVLLWESQDLFDPDDPKVLKARSYLAELS